MRMVITVTPEQAPGRGRSAAGSALPAVDVRAVWERIGATPESQVRWLLAFAKRELRGLSSVEWLEIGSEARVFALQPGIPGFRLPLPSERLLTRWQRWLRGGLGQLEEGTWWETIVGRRQLRIQYAKGMVQEEYSYLEGESFWDDVTSAFREHVLRALANVRGRLRFCQECRKPFVARKRQAYCTPGCSQKSRTRTYRGRNPEKVRDRRRRAYIRTQQRRHGSKVRVSRKRRVARPGRDEATLG